MELGKYFSVEKYVEGSVLFNMDLVEVYFYGLLLCVCVCVCVFVVLFPVNFNEVLDWTTYIVNYGV